MGFWLIGTDHLTGDGIIKGVNFGGHQDKVFAPTPNVGNKCASPYCPSTFIHEGAAARFAHNNSSLWCHKLCADEWERRDPGFAFAPPVQQETFSDEKCLCPHPEDYEILCTKSVEQHHYHSDGTRSWYAQPAQVANLKHLAAQRAALQAPVAAPEVMGSPEEAVAIHTLSEGQSVHDIPVADDDTAAVEALRRFCEGEVAELDASTVTDDQVAAILEDVANQGPDSSPDMDAIIAKHTVETHDHAGGPNIEVEKTGVEIIDAAIDDRAQAYDDYLNDDGTDKADDEDVPTTTTVHGTQSDQDSYFIPNDALPRGFVEAGRAMAERAGRPSVREVAEHKEAYLIRSVTELASIFGKHGHTSDPALFADLFEWKRSG